MDLTSVVLKAGFDRSIKFCRFIYQFYSVIVDEGIGDGSVNILDIKFVGDDKYIHIDNGMYFMWDKDEEPLWGFYDEDMVLNTYESYDECWLHI